MALVIGTLGELAKHTFVFTLACAGLFCPALLFGYLMREFRSDCVALFVAALVRVLKKLYLYIQFRYSVHRVYVIINT